MLRVDEAGTRSACRVPPPGQLSPDSAWWWAPASSPPPPWRSRHHHHRYYAAFGLPAGPPAASSARACHQSSVVLQRVSHHVSRFGDYVQGWQPRRSSWSCRQQHIQSVHVAVPRQFTGCQQLALHCIPEEVPSASPSPALPDGHPHRAAPNSPPPPPALPDAAAVADCRLRPPRPVRYVEGLFPPPPPPKKAGPVAAGGRGWRE
jgi:hypothetical protein